MEGGKLGDMQEVARLQAGTECIHHTDLGRSDETRLRCICVFNYPLQMCAGL